MVQRFDDTVAWLASLYGRPHVPAESAGLQRAEFLLDRLGNPHRDFRSVHVAGTGGKGSTTTMIGAMLQEAGNRTGYFRSPHLVSYRERIAVNEESIEESSWVRCFNLVAAIAEGMERGTYPNYGLGRPTLFEVLFAMAALHFRESRVEWAAIETGLGGRLDATNTVTSEVAVITNISLEHTRILGDTIEAIAAEKAGIIKRGSAAVTGSRDPRALAVIAERALEQEVTLRRIDVDYCVTRGRADLTSQELTLSDPQGTLHVQLPLGGDFQALNAATAFGAARALQNRGAPLLDLDIARGLEHTQIPGRFEVVARSPIVLLDGGHNPAAMRELVKSLDSVFPGRRIVLLFAAMIDKDVNSMATGMGTRVDTVVTTRAPGTERSASPETLAASFVHRVRKIQVVEDPADALTSALAQTGDDDVLVIAGSLYLVGWARPRLVGLGSVL